MLDYARHFVLLLALAAGLVGISRLAAGLFHAGGLLSLSGIASQFAVYGALHALALVSSLAPGPSTGRRIALVMTASAMSIATACLTVALLRRTSNLSGPWPILAAGAALGGWAYAGLIRCVLRVSLGARCAWRISLACAVAVGAAYPWVKRHPSDAGLWLAITWWLAFSVACAWQDTRRRR